MFNNNNYESFRADELREQRALLSKQLSELEKEKITETRTEERFRLEQVIARVKEDRGRLEKELREFWEHSDGNVGNHVQVESDNIREIGTRTGQYAQRRLDMDKEQKELVEVALNALERLLTIFKVERYVYLLLTALSFILLLYTGYMLVTEKAVNTEALVATIGSAGLVTASSARISYFFNRAFTLIEEMLLNIKK